MAVYYHGPCARITHAVFVVHCPSYQRFALRDLTSLRVIEQEASPLAIEALRSGSTSVAGAAAITLAAGRAYGAEVYDSPLVALGLLTVLFAAALVRGTCRQLAVTRYSLAAVYRGQRVTLFQTTDEPEFGQVKRALIRALQHLDDTR